MLPVETQVIFSQLIHILKKDMQMIFLKLMESELQIFLILDQELKNLLHLVENLHLPLQVENLNRQTNL